MPTSTPETEIYYEPEWLVDGGPPFSSAHCPDYEVDEDCDGNSVLSIVYDWDLKKWYVLAGIHGSETHCRTGTAIMETTNMNDAVEYLRRYMARTEQWRVENEEVQ